MKICRKCNKSKDESDFRKTYIKSVGKYYLRSYCKKCATKINNERRQRNQRDKLNKRRIEYYRKNKVKMNKQRHLNRLKEKLK